MPPPPLPGNSTSTCSSQYARGLKCTLSSCRSTQKAKSFWKWVNTQPMRRSNTCRAQPRERASQGELGDSLRARGNRNELKNGRETLEENSERQPYESKSITELADEQQ
ncbi:hypothetical protein GPALN_012311 [Globodera pallida]|nr:hypothetical protein GPALN_012311 [Globodera pallida]